MQDLVSALDEIVRHSEWGLCRAAEIEWKGLRRKQKSRCIHNFKWKGLCRAEIDLVYILTPAVNAAITRD